MAEAKKIGVLVGSLRKASFNRKMAKALLGLAPAGLELEIVEIGELPLYNEDLESQVPAAWSSFRQQIAACAGVIFVTPEYNRSIPAAVKNAVDVGSRPYGKGVWNGKPGAIVSVSPGALGAFGANHALRQALVFPDVQVMAQPEAYIGNAATLFAEDGSLAVEPVKEHMVRFLQAFEAHVERCGK
nr:NAD(P)H-dependent oxidoreductase [uncultured Holophaga sp.]